MTRAYYSDTIAHFLEVSVNEVIGALSSNSEYGSDPDQVRAWRTQIDALRPILSSFEGSIHFEFSIPRMGRRVDVILIIGGAIFVIEFKTGESTFTAQGLDQVCDYALDLKNFHEPSADSVIAPILIASEGAAREARIAFTPQNDNLLYPLKAKIEQLPEIIRQVLSMSEQDIDPDVWSNGRYCPTPTIIEAATALYGAHQVKEIANNEAGDNLTITAETIAQLIKESRDKQQKTICFVTGVPGAGKTLVGLDIATKHLNKDEELYSVFLSGNGPLVDVLREALARDKVRRGKLIQEPLTKKRAHSEVKTFIQNVHHFRDDCLKDEDRPPAEHVALFDEAQRAWNLEMTADFMRRKKKRPDFNQSEPAFLISCLDRHKDWAVVVCLIGGGQEINRGEAGMSEWIRAMAKSFPQWQIYMSGELKDEEYAIDSELFTQVRDRVNYDSSLHLKTSMRSFRSENVSRFIKELLDIKMEAAKTFEGIGSDYKIVLTRNISSAKAWLLDQARGTQRYGILVSSQAERLKPYAIDVKSPMKPIHWFLDGKESTRSSYYMEAVATEFHVQGLELDWTCVTWDADFRFAGDSWIHRSFKNGTKWSKMNEQRQQYLKNAYRVLLTRARQGMVICVPEGDSADPTRSPSFYDPTFNYLKSLGLTVI